MAAFQLSTTAKMTMIVTPEQAIAATLGCESASELIDRARNMARNIQGNLGRNLYSRKDVETLQGASAMLMELANALNAEIGGMCELELNTDMSAIRCSVCGYELPRGTDLGETRFCGGCGRKVKR